MGFPVFPLEWKSQDGEVSAGYREDGYAPEAVINMLAFLGWNPGTEQEIFTLDELIQAFELERVQKGGAKFDPEKTKWFQNQYFQKTDTAQISKDFKEFLSAKNIKSSLNIDQIVQLLKERAAFVSDLWEQGSFFFVTPEEYNPQASQKAFKPETPELLRNVVSILEF